MYVQLTNHLASYYSIFQTGCLILFVQMKNAFGNLHKRIARQKIDEILGEKIVW